MVDIEAKCIPDIGNMPQPSRKIDEEDVQLQMPCGTILDKSAGKQEVVYTGAKVMVTEKSLEAVMVE